MGSTCHVDVLNMWHISVAQARLWALQPCTWERVLRNAPPCVNIKDSVCTGIVTCLIPIIHMHTHICRHARMHSFSLLYHSLRFILLRSSTMLNMMLIAFAGSSISLPTPGSSRISGIGTSLDGSDLVIELSEEFAHLSLPPSFSRVHAVSFKKGWNRPCGFNLLEQALAECSIMDGEAAIFGEGQHCTVRLLRSVTRFLMLLHPPVPAAWLKCKCILYVLESPSTTQHRDSESKSIGIVLYFRCMSCLSPTKSLWCTHNAFIHCMLLAAVAWEQLWGG